MNKNDDKNNKIAIAILLWVISSVVLTFVGFVLNPWLGWLFNNYRMIHIILAISAIVALSAGIIVLTSLCSGLKNRHIVFALLFAFCVASGINYVRFSRYDHSFFEGFDKTYTERYGKCALIGEIYDGGPYDIYDCGYYAVCNSLGRMIKVNSKKEGEKGYYTFGNIFPGILNETGEKLIVSLNIDIEGDDVWHLEAYDLDGNMRFIFPKNIIGWEPVPFVCVYEKTEKELLDFFEGLSIILETNGITVNPEEFEKVRKKYIKEYYLEQIKN